MFGVKAETMCWLDKTKNYISDNKQSWLEKIGWIILQVPNTH